MAHSTWNQAADFIRDFHKEHSNSIRGIDSGIKGYTRWMKANVTIDGKPASIKITSHEFALDRETITLTWGEENFYLPTTTASIGPTLDAMANLFF